MRRFRSCIFSSSGLHSFCVARLRVSIQTCDCARAFGNGWFCLCFARYCLSISAVRVFSLYAPEACPFVPLMRIIPCSVSMSFCVVWCNSFGEHPISASIVNMGAYFLDALLMIRFMFWVVGINGVFSSTL